MLFKSSFPLDFTNVRKILKNLAKIIKKTESQGDIEHGLFRFITGMFTRLIFTFYLITYVTSFPTSSVKYDPPHSFAIFITARKRSQILHKGADKAPPHPTNISHLDITPDLIHIRKKDRAQ